MKKISKKRLSGKTVKIVESKLGLNFHFVILTFALITNGLDVVISFVEMVGFTVIGGMLGSPAIEVTKTVMCWE